jgi:hypothetical protein
LAGLGDTLWRVVDCRSAVGQGWRAVTDVPGMPSAEELSALPHAELAARLAEAYQLIGRLQARVEELERQVRQDSPASSRPPSSDSPYRKKPRDRSLRERGKLRPGKQPGDPGTTMSLADDPDERIELSPAGLPGLRRGPGRRASADTAPSPGSASRPRRRRR